MDEMEKIKMKTELFRTTRHCERSEAIHARSTFYRCEAAILSVAKQPFIARRAFILLPALLLALSGVAQNGITISNFSVKAGSPTTVTFDVDWNRIITAGKDSMWVFVDYNKAGTMTRLPVSGVTATPGTAYAPNNKGAWVIPQSGHSSTTVQLYTAGTFTLYGACAYATDYSPRGTYTSANVIKFQGTPKYEAVLNNAAKNPVTVSAITTPYTVPAGSYVQSYTDATGAPGKCIPMLGNIDFSIPAYVVKGLATTFTAVHPQAPVSNVITYHWSAPGFGATTGAGTSFNPTAPASSGTFPVTLTARAAGHCDKTVTKNVTVLNCIPPSTYTLSTSALSVCAGSAVTLTLSGSQRSEWKYQLYDGASPVGTAVSGTNGSIKFSTTPAVGGHTYTVRTVNGGVERCNVLASSSVTVTMHANPVIASSAPSTICYNTTAGLSAGVSGGTTTAMTYTWVIGGTSGTTTINTKTSQNLTANATYTVSVRNANGCTATIPSALTIPVAATFTAPANPAATTICNGKTVAFSLVAASGGIGAITYKWQQSTGSWADATGTNTNAAYTTPTLTVTTAFRRVAYNTCGTITSNSATVTVRPAFTPGSITTTGQTICSGASVNTITSSAAASGGDNSITYEWRYTGSSSGTITSNTASLSPSTFQNKPGSYTVTRWAKDNTCNAFTQSSGQWLLTVNSLPSISANPQLYTVCMHEAHPTLSVTATASGGATLSYQWKTGTGAGTNVGSTQTITPTVTATADYWVVVTDSKGCATTSTKAKVTVADLGGQIANGPACGAGPSGIIGQ